MITEKTIYDAECCNCGEAYIDDGSIVFYNRDKLEKDLVDDGWQIIGDKCYCPECKDDNN